MPKAIHKNCAGFCFVIVVLHTIAHVTKCTLIWLSLFFKSPAAIFHPLLIYKKAAIFRTS